MGTVFISQANQWNRPYLYWSQRYTMKRIWLITYGWPLFREHRTF